MATLKSYQQFADEMTPDQRAKAKKDFNEVFVGGEPLMCYSNRASDAEHCKHVLLTDKEYALIKDIVWESQLPDESMEQFEKELEEDDGRLVR
jgi:hypothetical protein